MTSHTPHPSATRARRRGVLLSSALAAGLLGLGGGAAQAAVTVGTAVEQGGCEIVSGDLTWGFKETFRAYISGNIAKGDWEPIDGAGYETPTFQWTQVTGDVAAEGTTGRADFTGGVHFTGHGGLLDTTIANPSLVLGPDGAQLLLDVRGLTMDDALEGNTENIQVAEGIPFATLDLSAGGVQRSDDGTLLTGADIPATITQEGFEAFGSYETGTPLDPVSFSLTLDCAVAEAVPEPAAEDTAAPEDAESDVAVEVTSAPAEEGAPAWLPWAIGGGAVVVLAGAGVAVWAVRRSSRTPGDGPGTSA